MQFKIRKYMSEGRYYVEVKLIEFDDLDRERSKIFGEPKLEIKISDGRNYVIKVSKVTDYAPYGFYKLEEASTYADNLREQIKILREYWANLNDNWSNEEVL